LELTQNKWQRVIFHAVLHQTDFIALQCQLGSNAEVKGQPFDVIFSHPFRA